MKRLVQLWAPRLLAAACLLSPLCPAAKALDDTITIKNGLVFVDAIINGHGPFRLLVDTGTTTTLLSPDAAAMADLAFDHTVLLTALDIETPLPATSTGDLRMASSGADGVEIVVAPMGRIRKRYPGTDGILGLNVLGRTAYLIDYVRKKLWLGEDAIRRADALPFVLAAEQSNGRTILPVTLQSGGASWRLTLDSGAASLILKCRQRCPVISDPRREERVVAVLGELPVVGGTLRRVEVAGASVSFVPVLLLDTGLTDGLDDGVIPSHWFAAVYVNGHSGLVRFAQRR